MPVETETIDVDSEIDRLEAEMQETADDLANWQGNSQYAARLMQRGDQLQKYISGLAYLRDERGVETLALQGLTAGERNLADDVVDDTGALPTAAYVAVGTRDAPWLAHDPDDLSPETIEPTIRNVADLPPNVMDWADERIGDLTHVGEDEGNGFMSLVAEKLAQQTSADESG